MVPHTDSWPKHGMSSGVRGGYFADASRAAVAYEAYAYDHFTFRSCRAFLPASFETRPSGDSTFRRKEQPVTRDLIAKRIHWSFIIWLAGMVNVTAMLPQLVRIIRTRNIEGLSLAMFVLYFLVQVAFSIE